MHSSSTKKNEKLSKTFNKLGTILHALDMEMGNDILECKKITLDVPDKWKYGWH